MRALLLWLLSGAFLLRVVGQALVVFLHARFLPPAEEWYSGLLPYGPLLVSQVLILVLMVKINTDFTGGEGLFARPNRRVGVGITVAAILYFAVMLIRYVVAMSLYPRERWTGGSIPIFFHWVLAAYLLTISLYHWRYGRRAAPRKRPGRLARFAVHAAQAGGVFLAVAGLAFWALFLLLPTLLARYLGMRGPQYAVRIDRNVALTTTDGVRLASDIYRPRRAGPTTPTILVRIPYSHTPTNSFFATLLGNLWAERGYTVVIQGTRGRYESGGAYDPLRHERADGIDTLDWIARQPWYDGRIGMWGGSYFGYTQWAIADRRSPGPSALMIQEASTDFHGMFYPGGAFSLYSALEWAVMSHGRTDVPPKPHTLEKGFDGFPEIQADDRVAGDIPFFDDWALHRERDAYWTQIDGDDRAGRLQAPALLMAGWYDPFLPTQLRDFVRIRHSPDPRVASESRLIVGPWTHAATVGFPDGVKPRNYRLESIAPSLDWFDHCLRSQPGRLPQPVRIYTMGVHRWRDVKDWPLPGTHYTAYYLRSRGHANTAAGDGALSTAAPSAQEAPDRYYYDPRNPVPTLGGAMIGSDGPIRKQNGNEARPDVLVYSTPPLEMGVEVTGPIHLVLNVGTSAPCTDFTAWLVDVFPDGAAYNLSDGVLRRRYRPNASTPTEITLELWPTSTIFPRGHRIGLEISSSNYPRFDRNPNTGRDIPTETAPVIASQTVYHDPKRASRLILPIQDDVGAASDSPAGRSSANIRR